MTNPTETVCEHLQTRRVNRRADAAVGDPYSIIYRDADNPRHRFGDRRGAVGGEHRDAGRAAIAARGGGARGAGGGRAIATAVAAARRTRDPDPAREASAAARLQVARHNG